MVTKLVDGPSRILSRRLFCLSLVALLLVLAGCTTRQTVPTPNIGESMPAANAAMHLPDRSVAESAEVLVAHNGQAVQALSAPDRLVLSSIDVDVPVVELGWHEAKNNQGQIFSEWDVAEYAAGWHRNSVLPGESGNVVMSGHNNILGAVFRELDQLRKGDEAIVWFQGRRHLYEVDQILIVPEKYATSEQRKQNALWIGDFPDDRLTLVSCWPRNDNTHRIVVVARPVDERQAAGR